MTTVKQWIVPAAAITLTLVALALAGTPRPHCQPYGCDWKTYRDAVAEYSFQYPPAAEVVEESPGAPVSFLEVLGPALPDRGGRWPAVSVRHQRYVPSAQAAYVAYVRYQLKNAWSGDCTTIGGIPALHFKDGGSLQSLPSDEYDFVRGDQLFAISWSHVGGERPSDGAVYTRLLQSFKFD